MIPSGWVEAPLQEGGYAVCRRWAESGPKGTPPWVYGPETDVYRTAREGEIVHLVPNGGAFSWNSRRTYIVQANSDHAVMILLADDLIGVAQG